MSITHFSTRHFLKRKQLKNINRELSRYYDHDFGLMKVSVERASSKDRDILIVDKIPVLFAHEGSFYLTLKGFEKYPVNAKYVTVDMGAVPYLANGADIMAPGIIDADVSIAKGDIVWIRDERNLRPLSVGKSSCSGEELKARNKGKVISTIHYVGDDLWTAEL